MKKLTMLLALGATVALMPSVSKAGIIGGPHDFGNATNASMSYAMFAWGGAATTNADGSVMAASYYNNPCQICHIPHKAPSFASQNAPLWNHAKSANATYVTYDLGGSTTFNQGLKSTLGNSIACLSCHDGSVAINQSYGKATTTKYGTNQVAGLYASGFAVETALATAGDWSGVAGGGTSATASGGRNDLTHMHPIGIKYDATIDPTLKVPSGILSQMLKGGQVECSSCHDIHGAIGASGTVSHELIVDLNNAALCTTCHKQ